MGATDKVVTFSIHKYEPGYFPGTGALTDTGTGRGRHHSINIPLQEGVTDQMYRHVFCSLFPSIISSFMPDCIVLQCGADCLTGDTMGGFNLTPDSITACVDDVLLKMCLSYFWVEVVTTCLTLPGAGPQSRPGWGGWSWIWTFLTVTN